MDTHACIHVCEHVIKITVQLFQRTELGADAKIIKLTSEVPQTTGEEVFQQSKSHLRKLRVGSGGDLMFPRMKLVQEEIEERLDSERHTHGVCVNEVSSPFRT